MFVQSRWTVLGTALAAAAVLWPGEAEAQWRHRGRVFVGAVRPYYPVFHYPYFYPGWYGWHPYDIYWQRYPYPYYPYRYDYTGSARIQVTPRDAEVYVDGYFVGSVDDFDGWLQRLNVELGEHEIAVYHPQYRTYRERVLFRPGATLKIEASLDPLQPGDAPEPKPTPAAPTEPRQAPRTRDPYPEPRATRGGDPQSDSGAVAIRVQPRDAEVLIDGERWEAPSGGERLVVQLSDGEHRVEIRREGYRPFTTTIRVRRGETAPLNVSLARE